MSALKIDATVDYDGEMPFVDDQLVVSVQVIDEKGDPVPANTAVALVDDTETVESVTQQTLDDNGEGVIVVRPQKTTRYEVQIHAVNGSESDYISLGDVVVSEISSFSAEGTPTLSNSTASSIGTDGGEGHVDTNIGLGSLYWIVTTSTTTPNEQQIKDGKRANGNPADDSGVVNVSTNGTQTVSANGLTVGSVYTFFWVQETTDGFSNIASASFSTDTSPLSASLSLTENDPSVSVTGSASNGSSPYSYAWDWGDGSTSTGSNASHTYQTDSTHTVTLTVTDDDGNTATDSTSVTITGADVEVATDLTAGSGSEEATVSWTSSPDSDLTEERLYRSTNTPVNPANDTLVTTISSPSGGTNQSFLDTGLVDGQTYYYAVQTEDTSGNTALSNETAVTPTSSVVVGQINYDFSQPDYSGTGATL